jgi:hypothetical protein
MFAMTSSPGAFEHVMEMRTPKMPHLKTLLPVASTVLMGPLA